MDEMHCLTNEEIEDVNFYIKREPMIPTKTAIRIACETIDNFEVIDGYEIKKQIENRMKNYNYNIFQF